MLYKREFINSFETIGYSCCIMMSIVIGPKWSFYSCCDYIGLLGTGFMQVLYLGRAPRTKEALPDFLEWRRVTRHPLVFRGLTGSQRTPEFGAYIVRGTKSEPDCLLDLVPGRSSQLQTNARPGLPARSCPRTKFSTTNQHRSLLPVFILFE